MPALAASDVTITVQEENIEGKKHRNRCKIAFGNGVLTYPPNGVPMPAAEKFGLRRNLDYLILTDTDDAQGILWKYDQDNVKVRGYILGVDITAAGALTLDDFPLDTTDQPFATAISLGLAGAAAGVNYLGRMQELATTHAPAAQTLFCEAVGW